MKSNETETAPGVGRSDDDDVWQTSRVDRGRGGVNGGLADQARFGPPPLSNRPQVWPRVFPGL